MLLKSYSQPDTVPPKAFLLHPTSADTVHLEAARGPLERPYCMRYRATLPCHLCFISGVQGEHGSRTKYPWVCGNVTVKPWAWRH